MTPFEFVLTLITMITSLALTKIITGVVSIIRHKDRHGFSLTHALWVWVAFAVVVGNWGSLWSERTQSEWHPAHLFVSLVAMVSLYAFCALVVPDFEQGVPLNLKEFHERDGTRYIIAHNVFAILSALMLALEVHIAPQSAVMFAPPVIAFALGTAALLTRGRARLLASILLAMLAFAYMFTHIDILSSGMQT